MSLLFARLVSLFSKWCRSASCRYNPCPLLGLTLLFLPLQPRGVNTLAGAVQCCVIKRVGGTALGLGVLFIPNDTHGIGCPAVAESVATTVRLSNGATVTDYGGGLVTTDTSELGHVRQATLGL